MLFRLRFEQHFLLAKKHDNLAHMQLLDGKKARESYTAELITKIKALSFTPHLVIIQVGNRSDSTAFIKAKKSFAQKIGVTEEHIILPESISQEDLIQEVKKYNENKKVTGLIVQLPLPLHIDADEVIESINPSKDVDGLTSYNVKRWVSGRSDAIMPATPRGIRELLNFYKIDLAGKKVTMIGRSTLVGKPIAVMCLNQNATVTICHSKTVDLAKETKDADVLIVATGKPGLIGKSHVNKNQIVIDVGITHVDGKITGDVDFEAVKDHVAWISPVPGGVGQMTVLALFENLVEMCYASDEITK